MTSIVKITVVIPRDLVRGTADRARLWHGTTHTRHESFVFLARDEGVSWARGWLAENSDEGKALIAAYDLVHG